MPLAVWPTTTAPPTNTATTPDAGPLRGGLSTELARRIVEEYSQPGDLVLDLACTAETVLVAAASTRRRAAGITASDRAAAAAFDAAAAQLTDRQATDVEVITADLGGLWQLRPDLATAADLAIFAAPGAHSCAGESEAGAAAAEDPSHYERGPLEAARTRLRPGGVLVTVSMSGNRGGAFHDAAGELVRLAIRSGFGYTQHVIALRTPIDDDHLTVTPSDAEVAELRADRHAGGRRHLVVHQDVSVFISPGPKRPAPREEKDVIA